MLKFYHPHNILKCNIFFFVIGWYLIMVFMVTSITSHCESLVKHNSQKKN
ncbi:hypothetical protein F383_33301 [Gossypium arboreum]|uniref:Uncharacterized protein n=1 Tax=Gossypium arboreum TaxID=29729 RepID=A0A0B0MXW5_GOSAR|nr:hypothetical protein F383_33301 [Gossypium arboreum]